MRVQHVLAERGFSGGEVQLQHLVEHLHARGHDNHFVLAPGADFEGVARRIAAPVVEVDLRRPLRPRTAATLRAAVRRAQPDVLHFGCGRSLLWGGWFARRETVPVRVTTRRIDYPIRPGRLHGGRYRRLVDHTVANCESVRRAVLAAGVPADRVSLIHEGIDMAPWASLPDASTARAGLGLAEDALVVSCAATLRPRKGQRLLIEAAAALVGKFPNLVVVLAGTGADHAELERRVERAGLREVVRLPGAVKPVAALYAASDLFCMPSYNEGLSNACLEASAAGLPLVVSAVGGLPEIVEHRSTGLVVPPGEAGALTEALAQALADGGWRAAAGAAGAARTRRLFAHTAMAERMEALFSRLVAERNVRGTQA